MTIMELAALARFDTWAKRIKAKRAERERVKANLNKLAKYKKSAKGRLLAKKRRNKKIR